VALLQQMLHHCCEATACRVWLVQQCHRLQCNKHVSFALPSCAAAAAAAWMLLEYMVCFVLSAAAVVLVDVYTRWIARW
jgi:hypothetical protein